MRVKRLELGDFATHLGPRYRENGPYSGEEYRETILRPAVEQNDVVVIGLDSIRGYSASFLEEAFGGLVEEVGYETAMNRLQLDAVERGYLVPLILKWMKDEGDRQAKGLKRRRD